MAKTVADDIMFDAASETNSQPFTITFAEAASQTFKKGEVVYLAAGLVTEIASDTPANIIGIANQDAHNLSVAGVPDDPARSVSVTLAPQINIFAANVKTTSLADHVLLVSDLGRVMGIQRDTTNSKVFLNAAVVGGANGRVFTLRTAQNTDVGDTNGRVLFVWLPGFIQGETTS